MMSREKKILYYFSKPFTIQRCSSMNEVNNVAAQIHAQVVIHFPAIHTRKH